MEEVRWFRNLLDKRVALQVCGVQVWNDLGKGNHFFSNSREH